MAGPRTGTFLAPTTGRSGPPSRWPSASSWPPGVRTASDRRRPTGHPVGLQAAAPRRPAGRTRPVARP